MTVPISTRFPWYCETAVDQAEIAYLCPFELAEWRRVLAQHKSQTTINGKLRLRPALERAYAALRSAYVAAINAVEPANPARLAEIAGTSVIETTITIAA